MRRRVTLSFTTLSAVAVFAVLVSSASANRLADSSATVRVTWTSIEFNTSFFTEPMKCPLTVEGSFHSKTLSKVAEQLVGYVTAAAIASSNCTGGSARILPETLPWHIRYDSFTGTLPNIATIKLRVVGLTFLIQTREPFGAISACLYKSTAASPLKGVVERETGGAATTVRPESAGIPLFASLETGICPASGTLRGASGSTTVLGSTAKITITLVQ